jgi:hypothetical protein
MAKIDLGGAVAVVKKHEEDPVKVRKIAEEMGLLAQPTPDGDGEPKEKLQFVVVLSDPDGRMPKADFVAWVVQIPESESPATTLDRIYRGAFDFNNSRRGSLMPVKTVGEAIETVKAKQFKEAGLAVKTKVPVLVIVTDNQIPKGAGSEPIAREDKVSYSIHAGGKTVFTTDVDGVTEADIIEAEKVVRATNRGSTSILQRRMRIGYNRAARLMDELEKRGVVGPENGSSPREILQPAEALPDV